MKKLFQIMEQNDTRLGKAVDFSLLVLIVLNICFVVIDSFSEIHQKYLLQINIFEIFSVSVFSIEYVLRLICSPYRYSEKYNPLNILRYMFSPMAIIDLLAIVPFYLPAIIPYDLRFIRILRLFRLIRVLKIKRYSKAIDLISTVLLKKKMELFLSSFILMIMIFLSGSLMYFLENDIQPNVFPNIIESVKWSIKTMVFLGFEAQPLSIGGNILGMITVVLGLGWLTLPISIISAGFIEKINEKEKVCPHCGQHIE
jgi:voltage-gated potassium channel